MTHHKSNDVPLMNRRNFVKQVGLTTFGGTLSLGLINQLFGNDPNQTVDKDLSAFETKNIVEGMSYIPLGRTKLMVSRLSLGGVPCQPMVMRRAIDAGVNLIHGANHYGTMPEQAQVLKPVWDKVWYFLKHLDDKGDMGQCLDRCLKTLNRDYVDAILPVIDAAGSVDYDELKTEFDKYHKAGKVRFLGATIHTNDVPGVLKSVIDADIFDIILTMYQPEVKDAADKELNRAINKNIGTMSMKTLQGVKDEDQAKVALATLSGGTIHTLLKGIKNMSSLKLYLKVAGEAGQNKTTVNLRDCADPGVCGACGLCLSCPQHIAIPEIMRCATYYTRQEGLEALAQDTYHRIPVHATVWACQDCGQCENLCPRRLPIRKILAQAHRQWA